MKKKIFLAAALALTIILVVSACSDGGDSKSSVNLSKFKSEDLNGAAVDGSIFAKADLTVLNIWGTFCGPCIEEMPELGELSREYKGSGIQIVGIPADVNSDATMKSAKEIVSSTKADYLHIMPSEDLEELYLNRVTAVPETLFIDKNGDVIEKTVGAHSKSDWKDLIDKVYKQVKKDDK